MAKFTVTFKDPDHNTQDEAGNDVPYRSNSAADKIKSMFLEYDEYLTVEFDTVTKTARVVPVKEMKS